VAVGMALATDFSVRTGFLKKHEGERIRSLIRQFELPVKINIDFEKILKAMRKDKKREGEFMSLILLAKIGQAVIHKMSFEQLEKEIYDLR